MSSGEAIALPAPKQSSRAGEEQQLSHLVATAGSQRARMQDW